MGSPEVVGDVPVLEAGTQMIARALESLANAAQLPAPGARLMAYSAAIALVSPSDQGKVIMVLAEGAMRGPDAARGMAQVLGG